MKRIRCQLSCGWELFSRPRCQTNTRCVTASVLRPDQKILAHVQHENAEENANHGASESTCSHACGRRRVDQEENDCLQALSEDSGEGDADDLFPFQRVLASFACTFHIERLMSDVESVPDV